MKKTRKPASTLRYTLGVLLAFGALNAFGGGYYGMSGAEGVPLEWLEGSPFKNFFIPSLILFIVVGGSFLATAILCFAGYKYARQSVFATVAIVYTWLIVQMIIIGYVSWMQPTTAGWGILCLILAWYLPKQK
ncbi:MAG: hypothetical protein ACD_77C00282G0006 [uncultured bacterium]|nr:MAG: hypothetical protein ACD_77C00282G0006 [uncultured bacterium]